jgi:hypothetical protein
MHSLFLHNSLSHCYGQVFDLQLLLANELLYFTGESFVADLKNLGTPSMHQSCTQNPNLPAWLKSM